MYHGDEEAPDVVVFFSQLFSNHEHICILGTLNQLNRNTVRRTNPSQTTQVAFKRGQGKRDLEVMEVLKSPKYSNIATAERISHYWSKIPSSSVILQGKADKNDLFFQKVKTHFPSHPPISTLDCSDVRLRVRFLSRRKTAWLYI